MKLKYVIARIIDEPVIRSQPQCITILNKIDKYAGDEHMTAYMLGLFFKNIIDSDQLSVECKDVLIAAIKSGGFRECFYSKGKKYSYDYTWLWFLLVLAGVLVIIAGVVRGLNGNYNYGIGTKYLVPGFISGGYDIIFGSVLFIGGLLSMRHGVKRKQLIKLLNKPESVTSLRILN